MTLESVDLGARMRRAAADLGLQSKLAEADTSAEDVDAEEVDEAVMTSREEEGITPTPEEDQAVADTSADSHKLVSSRNVFQHPSSHALVLDLVLLQKYGPEWMTWEPETLRMRIEFDFQQGVSDLNVHKIQAMKTLHFVDTFWTEWEVFCWVAMAINGVPPDFNIMQVPTVAQAMIAVDVANRVRSDVPFSLELNDYLEQVHMFNGILCPIEPLEFVTMDDVEDYPVEPKEIKALWLAVRATGKHPQAESTTAEQLRRMLDLRIFLEESRTTLKAQLPLVGRV